MQKRDVCSDKKKKPNKSKVIPHFVVFNKQETPIQSMMEQALILSVCVCPDNLETGS